MTARLPSFDDISDDQDNSGMTQGEYIPFQHREDPRDDDKTLMWLNENFDALYQMGKDRLMTYRRLAARYKNAGDTMNGLVRSVHRDLGDENDKPKVRTNFFVEYIDQKVAQVSKMRQNPVFIPLNDSEQDDVNNADACNMLVKFRMKELGIQALMRDQDRKTYKYGHSFARVYWDETAGPLIKGYTDIKKKYGKVVEVSEDGQETGTEISETQAKIGDVGLEIVDTDCVFPERFKKKWKNVDFVDYCEFVNLHDLRAQYEDKGIKKEDYFWLDVDNKGYNSGDMVMKHTFYHRPTKWLPYGEVICYVEGKILDRITDPELLKRYMPDGELPFVPDTDIDMDDEFWARPFLINIEQQNNLYDLVQSGMARNIGVASHPKLLIAEGSVNLKQADNKYGVMQWRGANKPEWMQHNYINRGEFEIMDRAEKRMDKASKVYDISKGQVPTGITATSALRLLDDQEIQANSEALEKRRERIKAVYWKVMKFMDANYRQDEDRVARILGDNNEYLIKSFNKFDFGKIYSVDIENISALQDTRSGRVSDIIDLNAANQKEPTFGRKEIIKLLDLGLEKAFVDEISQASTTSKTILQMLKHGEEAMAPEFSDDLIEMYTIFSRFLESMTYKMKLKQETRDTIKEYVKGLEYLMAEQSKKNMLFAMELKKFIKYPMFYSVGAEITAAPPAMPGLPPAGAGTNAPPPSKGTGLPNLNEKAQADLEQENGDQA